MSTARTNEKTSQTKTAWKCSLCGYLETRYPDGLPADYRCPLCNAQPVNFVKVEIEDEDDAEGC